mgnify:FL=1
MKNDIISDIDKLYQIAFDQNCSTKILNKIRKIKLKLKKLKL